MAKESIIIIDYGSGNLRSAAKAFEYVCKRERLDFDVRVSGDPNDILNASRLVLPGQGAFGDCMSGLQSIDGMIEALEEIVLNKSRPFLGICVGMQLMATRGLEHGTHAGLGWIPGEVKPIQATDKSIKIPHMGWNVINVKTCENALHPVLRGVFETQENAPHFYFVHSFMVQCKNKHDILAHTDYGENVTAVIGRDNIIGVQFHPEKSQDNGLRLISDFLSWTP